MFGVKNLLLLKNRRFQLLFITFLLTFSQSFALVGYAKEDDKKNEDSSSNVKNAAAIVGAVSELEEKYSTYLKENEANSYTGKEINFKNVSELVKDHSFLDKYEGEKVIKIDQGEEVTVTLQAPATSLYQIGLDYAITGKNILPTQIELKVNREFPFYELRNLVFESKWKNPEEIKKDKYGNDIIPQPVKVDEWQKKYLNDTSYRNSDPFLIELKKGTNQLTLKSTEGNLLIRSIDLSPQLKLENYEKEPASGDGFVLIEAEDMTYKNDSSIRANALFDADLTPYHSDRRVLNYLDGDAFKSPGHKVTYTFEVEESGFYYLGMHYRQNVKADFPVFVNFLIDGEIPFQELKNYPIDYTTNFTNTTLLDSKSGEELPVYLEAGQHTLSLAISIDPIKDTIEEIEQMLGEIQALSLELTNLVGPNVDRNRDIDVEMFIPGVTDLLNSWADQLNRMYEDIKIYNPEVAEIGAFSSLTISEKQLRSMAKDIDKLIVRKNELSTGTNSITAYLGNLLQEINNNGLSIDKLYFYQDKKDIPKSKNFLSKQYLKVERLFKSFGDQDYSVKSVDKNHLQVWVNRPRQYVEIMQQLIDEQFTPETGIKVDLSLMPDQNKLILANAAGDAPDVALGVNYALPFEVAIRGALVDLSEFADFEEVSARFPKGLHIPATVQGGVYALPDTMNFWVLFYRKDILNTLDLKVPDTLDQVRTYLPELQRKGMNFFYPTAGMPGMKTFAGTMPIIYQNGGEFYGESIGRTQLNENASIEGMRQLTDLFTIYNTPYEVPSFYQQFRDGSIPIGISDYFMYNLILNAAPEIANSWDIALMPGIENEADEIERWSAGGAESNIIFQDTNKKDESWEFLKWWSSTEIQVSFGNILQTTYGEEYIWNTANVEAFNGLPWKTSHKDVILAQTDWLTEVPRVPGSYMLERELSNAYNSVVLDGENLRTAIDLASKRINRETFRKLEEFGFMKNEEIIELYENPESNFK